LNKLKKDPNVEKVYFNKIFHLALDESVPRIDADDVWNIEVGGEKITGKGETVCVIDTGIDYTHTAFGGCSTPSFLAGNCSKVLGGYDFVNDDEDPMDDNGHGTHVAGIAAGNHSVYTGVAKDAGIVSIKVCGSNGACEAADLIAGIEWCANNASKYNISVISMSLGDGSKNNVYCNNDPIAPSINSAVEEGLSVVIAAGNNGYTDGISSPACVQNATPAGAVNSGDNVVYNRGELLDLLAPGTSITAPYNNGGTKTLSGTSMSAPHVAGSFALFRQHWRLASDQIPTPQQIEDKFRITGVIIDDASNSGRNYSLINVYAALQPFINFTTTSISDGSLINVGNVLVNITSDVVLSIAFLEFSYSNGSVFNFTMQQSTSTNYYYNLYNLSYGQHTYKVYGGDPANLFGVSAKRTITIDTSNPSVNITTPANNTKLNHQLQPFNVTIYESNIDSVIFSFDNSSGNDFNLTPTNNSGNWNLDLDISSLANGNHVMKVIAADLAGNINDSQQVHFTIDHTAPDVEFLSPQDGSNYTISSGNRVFNVSVNDSSPISSVQFLFDNSTGKDFNVTAVKSNSSSTWSASYNVSSLMDGLHSVTVRAEDENGNVNNSVSVVFTVDNTVPLVTLISPSSGSVFNSASGSQIFNASINDTLSSVSSLLFLFDNSTGKDFNVTAVKSNSSSTWSASYNVSSLMDGLHVVTISARDYLGNTNNSISLNFTVDKTSPSVTLSSPDNNLGTSNNTITFSCSVEDNSGLSSMTLYGNWNDWHANETRTLTGAKNSTEFVQIIPDGSYFWNCLATDTESHSSFSSQNRTILVDSIEPLITNVSFISLTQNSADVSWLINEDSNYSINYGITLNLGTAASSNSFHDSHSLSFSGLSSSTTYYLNITACDALGNCNTSGPYSFTTDETVSEEDGSDESDSGSSSSSGGSSGGGGGGSSGSSGTSIASEIEENLEPQPQQIIEETSPEQEVEENQDELEQELSAPDEAEEAVVAELERGFGSMITGLFSAFIPSDSKAGWYVISSIVGLAILISVVLLLIHRRGRKDEFADDEEEEADINYNERLP